MGTERHILRASLRLLRRPRGNSTRSCTFASADGVALRARTAMCDQFLTPWTIPRAFSSLAAPQQQTTADEATVALLERSLAAREPAKALALFNELRAPPHQLLSQKLAMLLAKRGDAGDATRAADILRSVYMRPALQPDDYTRLASIYVVDACIRHSQLDLALDIYEEAFNVGVMLDLPAYDAMVRALVQADRLDVATDLLQDLASANEVAPTERSYLPLLEALIERQDYHAATSLLQQGRERGVQFTSETFYPLVELAEADDDATDSMVTFLSYVETVWDEAKVLVMDDEDDDDDEKDANHGDDKELH